MIDGVFDHVLEGLGSGLRIPAMARVQNKLDHEVGHSRQVVKARLVQHLQQRQPGEVVWR